jgi:hypothetical protein
MRFFDLTQEIPEITLDDITLDDIWLLLHMPSTAVH